MRHSSVTVERVVEMVKRYRVTLDNPGICFACGEEAHECEPDARNFRCDDCGKYEVYGAEEALMEVYNV
jgi:predicted RNA-binding Zn-ribbon protein involved in translation (DUF1610 family)